MSSHATDLAVYAKSSSSSSSSSTLTRLVYSGGRSGEKVGQWMCPGSGLAENVQLYA